MTSGSVDDNLQLELWKSNGSRFYSYIRVFVYSLYWYSRGVNNGNDAKRYNFMSGNCNLDNC